MSHRKLRATPHTPCRPPICVPHTVTIFQKRDQKLSRQAKFLPKLRRTGIPAPSKGLTQAIDKRREVISCIVPSFLNLHDFASTIQEAKDRLNVSSELLCKLIGRRRLRPGTRQLEPHLFSQSKVAISGRGLPTRTLEHSGRVHNCPRLDSSLDDRLDELRIPCNPAARELRRDSGLQRMIRMIPVD